VSISQITLDGRLIGYGSRPYIIAELSGNHNGDIERGFALMAAAKQAGADAVKLQTYTADTITIPSDRPEFQISGGLWDGRTLHDLYQEAHTPWEWHAALFAKAREIGITLFSSPFDTTAVDFLESLDVPAYKIASPELVDLPLIRKAAATGKPLIMSTGMGTEEEIAEAVEAARSAGCRELILLHCVSAYPAPAEEACLANIPELFKRFGVTSGLSDHTLGIEISLAAVALGASVIEKHFTLSRAEGGVDSAFSLEPAELAELCRMSHIVQAAVGKAAFGPKPSELRTCKFRRSLYVVADVEAGGIFHESNVRSIRPANGLAPKHLGDILGKRASRAISQGEPLNWDMLA
jgi:N-acetylneuraminate synthase